MNLRLILTLAVAGLVATGSAQDTPDDHVRVRLINALPGQGVSVAIGTQQLFSGIAYGQITPYKTIPEQDDDVKLVVTTSDGMQIRPADDDDLDDDDEDYTILVLPARPGGAQPEVKVIEMDDDRPADIKAHMSLINASAVVDSLELGINGDRIFSGVNRGQVSGPGTVDAGQRTVTVNQTGGEKSLLSVPVNIEAAKSYTTVVFSDQLVSIVDDSTPMRSLTSHRNPQTISTTGTISIQTPTVSPVPK